MKNSSWGWFVIATIGFGVTSSASLASAEPAPSKTSKAAPAKDQAAKVGKAALAEASPEAKPETSAEAGAAPPASPQSAHPAESMERKVSPFDSSQPAPPPPPSVEAQHPHPGYPYPPPGYGYPPPGYGYPPPGYGYPPPGYPPCYGYPPPGYPEPDQPRPSCRSCPRHAGERTEPELPPEQRPGYHAHDGFFLRLGLGGGYARTSVSIDNSKLTTSGASMSVELAIGAAIRPNLILFAEMVSDQMYGSTSKVLDAPYGRSMKINLQGFGPGLAYYFMPINIYVSGSVLLHKVSATYDDDDYDATDLSRPGFAANLMSGKDWWVSPNWSIGLAAHFMVGTAKDRSLYGYSDGGRWNSMALGLLMSATYN